MNSLSKFLSVLNDVAVSVPVWVIATLGSVDSQVQVKLSINRSTR